jgi:hypothetical protein
MAKLQPGCKVKITRRALRKFPFLEGRVGIFVERVNNMNIKINGTVCKVFIPDAPPCLMLEGKDDVYWYFGDNNLIAIKDDDAE